MAMRRVVVDFFRSYMHSLSSDLCDQLCTALDELLGNALEHGGRFHPKCGCELTYIRTARMILFQIRDAGPGFDPDDNSDHFHPTPHVDNSYKWAGGGVLSTAEDLVKFGSAHLKAGRLTPASLDLLYTSMKTADGKETGYGAGWDIQGRKVGHSGSAVVSPGRKAGGGL